MQVEFAKDLEKSWVTLQIESSQSLKRMIYQYYAVCTFFKFDIYNI